MCVRKVLTKSIRSDTTGRFCEHCACGDVDSKGKLRLKNRDSSVQFPYSKIIVTVGRKGQPLETVELRKVSLDEESVLR